MRKIVEARVLGPYAEKDRWRIIILEKGVRRSEYLGTLPEARKRMSQLKKQHVKAAAFTVGMMLEAYNKDREVTGKVLQLTAQNQADRIRDFMGSILETRVSNVTSTIAKLGFTPTDKLSPTDEAASSCPPPATAPTCVL